MDATDWLGAAAFLVMASLIALLAVVGDVSAWQRATLGVVAVLAAASGVLLARGHPANRPAQAAALTLLFGVQAVRRGSLLLGGGAVLMAAGTLVELYNWRAGTEYLRFG